MLSPNESFCLSSLAALREVSHVKATMSKTQAEQVLGSLVSRGWLLKSKYVPFTTSIKPHFSPVLNRKGRYSLSTRTLLELQPYLRNTYPDEIIDCTICMDVCPTFSLVLLHPDQSFSLVDGNIGLSMSHTGMQAPLAHSLLQHLSQEAFSLPYL